MLLIPSLIKPLPAHSSYIKTSYYTRTPNCGQIIPKLTSSLSSARISLSAVKVVYSTARAAFFKRPKQQWGAKWMGDNGRQSLQYQKKSCLSNRINFLYASFWGKKTCNEIHSTQLVERKWNHSCGKIHFWAWKGSHLTKEILWNIVKYVTSVIVTQNRFQYLKKKNSWMVPTTQMVIRGKGSRDESYGHKVTKWHSHKKLSEINSQKYSYTHIVWILNISKGVNKAIIQEAVSWWK